MFLIFDLFVDDRTVPPQSLSSVDLEKNPKFESPNQLELGENEQS